MNRSRSTGEGTNEEKLLAFLQEGLVSDYRQSGLPAAPLSEISSAMWERRFVNRLICEKMTRERLLKLVGLEYDIEAAQQEDYKVLLNQALGEMGQNKIKENGPTTIYTQINPSPSYANMLQARKRLYHRWREKNPIGHHNKNKGLPNFKASWESSKQSARMPFQNWQQFKQQPRCIFGQSKREASLRSSWQ